MDSSAALPNDPRPGPRSSNVPTSSSQPDDPALEGSTGSNNDIEPALRRGHSDGEVLTTGTGPYGRTLLGATGGGHGETWQDFVRQMLGSEEDQLERSRGVVRRAALVAADRKRRMQQTREDFNRRRSYTTGYGTNPVPGERRSTGLRPSINTSAGMPPPPPAELRETVIDAERPLPRVPSSASSRGSRHRDYVLPRWQPDAEVSECPICGRAFAFWYRKHHCRKCGRVVCAACSPHRITIPRQFIVHPPTDPESGIIGSPSISEVIDLTGDDNQDDSVATLPAQARRGSQNYRLDPALGGGQEVRLCNPCVPDPNPLPPPTYSQSTPRTFTSFPRPESIPPTRQAPARPSRSGVLGLSAISYVAQPSIPGEDPLTSSDSSSRRHTIQSNFSFPANHASSSTNSGRPSHPPPDNRVPFHYPGSTADERAAHHTSRFNPQIPPPSFRETPYGSAPGTSYPNVSLHGVLLEKTPLKDPSLPCPTPQPPTRTPTAPTTATTPPQATSPPAPATDPCSTSPHPSHPVHPNSAKKTSAQSATSLSRPKVPLAKKPRVKPTSPPVSRRTSRPLRPDPPIRLLARQSLVLWLLAC